MFRRDKGHTLSSFIESEKKIDDKVDEEDEDIDFEEEEEEYQRPQLDPVTQGLYSTNFYYKKIKKLIFV